MTVGRNRPTEHAYRAEEFWEDGTELPQVVRCPVPFALRTLRARNSCESHSLYFAIIAMDR
ncbi:uncharacterized protein N7458_008327 [Penicillium daleae]|uniref:Uncharacterized protein n=1 Tax=Penicillium daleae TaxID=63821 RepID=A0AAD6C4M4_9EURO|nr:uncharacterized protein N7458_008327 [Penicillium daleae]KAJ5444455.1 hypothetical protein N7458_008327 [Penicillium daleae]